MLNGVLGVALLLAPFFFAGDTVTAFVTIGLGLALVLLSLRRGPIQERYGNWSRLLV